MKNTCPFSGKNIQLIQHPVTILSEHGEHARAFSSEYKIKKLNQKYFFNTPSSVHADDPESHASSIEIKTEDERIYELSSCITDQVYELSYVLHHMLKNSKSESIWYNGNFLNLTTMQMNKINQDQSSRDRMVEEESPKALYISINNNFIPSQVEDREDCAWPAFPFLLKIPALSYPSSPDSLSPPTLSRHPSILSPVLDQYKEEALRFQNTDEEDPSAEDTKHITLRTFKQTHHWFNYLSEPIDSPFNDFKLHKFHILNQKKMFANSNWTGISRKDIAKNSESAYDMILRNFNHPVVVFVPSSTTPTTSPFNSDSDEPEEKRVKHSKQKLSREPAFVIELFDFIASMVNPEELTCVVHHPIHTEQEIDLEHIVPVRADTHHYTHKNAALTSSSSSYSQMLKTYAILRSIKFSLEEAERSLPPSRILFGDRHELVAVPFHRFCHFFGLGRSDIINNALRPLSIGAKQQLLSVFKQIPHMKKGDSNTYCEKMCKIFQRTWNESLAKQGIQHVPANVKSKESFITMFLQNNRNMCQKYIPLQPTEGFEDPFVSLSTEGGAHMLQTVLLICQQDLVDDVMEKISILHKCRSGSSSNEAHAKRKKQKTTSETEEDDETEKTAALLQNILFKLFNVISQMLETYVIPVPKNCTSNPTARNPYESDSSYFAYLITITKKNIFPSYAYVKKRIEFSESDPETQESLDIGFD